MTRQHNGDVILAIRLSSARSSRVWTCPWTFRNRTNSCGFSVVAFQNATEFGLTANAPFGLWDKVHVEHRVGPADTSMRATFVIKQPQERTPTA